MSMEKEIGVGSSSGFGVSDKASILESDVELGLKSQSSESSPFKMIMSHHHHQRRPLSSSETVVDGGGSTCSKSSGAKETVVVRSITMNNIYHRDDAATTTTGAVVRTLQPFDTTPTAITTHTPFKSPVEGMAATLGYAFTSAQLKELQRQASIYKYMLASVPLPPHLLLPITGNLSADYSHSTLLGSDSKFNLRFSGNKDPEPGRCRRTDGKKWRCSRDVAPNQKYCDRHLHRGRPRSRKHVEAAHHPFNKDQHNNILNTTTTTTTTDTGKKKTRLNHQFNPTTTPVAVCKPMVHTNMSSSPQFLGSTIQPNETPFLFHKSSDHKSISASSYKEPSRGLDWMLEGEMVKLGTAGQQLMQTNIGLSTQYSIYKMQTNIELSTECSIYNNSANAFQQVYRDEPLSLFPYTDFGNPETNQINNEYSLFPHPQQLVSLEKKPQIDSPRGFIDAWSNDNSSTNISGSVSSLGSLSPSSLTLSMAMGAGTVLNEEMGEIQMALGPADLDHNYEIGGGSDKSQVLSWLSPLPWEASTPGGPLAEALRPTSSVSAVGGPSPASPYASNGDSIGTPATTVSSPSGILHRTMLSFSDSSGCNSPTLAASAAATPEFITFQRLST